MAERVIEWREVEPAVNDAAWACFKLMRGEVGDAAPEFDDVKSDLAEYLLGRLDGYDPGKARPVTFARRVLDNGIKEVRRRHYRHISRYVPLSAAAKTGHGLGRLADEEGYDLLHLNGPEDTKTDTARDAFADRREREEIAEILHRFDGDPVAQLVVASIVCPSQEITAARAAYEARGGIVLAPCRVPTDVISAVYGIRREIVSAALSKVRHALSGGSVTERQVAPAAPQVPSLLPVFKEAAHAA